MLVVSNGGLSDHLGGWSHVWGQRSQPTMNWILLKKREEGLAEKQMQF